MGPRAGLDECGTTHRDSIPGAMPTEPQVISTKPWKSFSSVTLSRLLYCGMARRKVADGRHHVGKQRIAADVESG